MIQFAAGFACGAIAGVIAFVAWLAHTEPPYGNGGEE